MARIQLPSLVLSQIMSLYAYSALYHTDKNRCGDRLQPSLLTTARKSPDANGQDRQLTIECDWYAIHDNRRSADASSLLRMSMSYLSQVLIQQTWLGKAGIGYLALITR